MKIGGVLETSLYVSDLARSIAFYRDCLKMPVMLETPRIAALDAGRSTVLLLFPKGAAAQDVHDARGVIPGHDGAGRLHLAFAIEAGELDSWRARLETAGVVMRGEYAWPRGGTSLYFEDPDGHVVELATPGIWPTY